MNMRITAMTSALTLSLGVLALAPSAAHAGGQDGVTNNNELVFAFNSGGAGSKSDFANAKEDLAGHYFLTSGNGKGVPVKNNAASVRNTHSLEATVFYATGHKYVAGFDIIPGNSGWRNLSAHVKNHNRSFNWWLPNNPM